VAPVVSSPTAGCASPLDRLGFGVLVGCTARSTWYQRRWPPPPFIWRRATGAHQPSGLGAPDQGAFVRARPDSDPLGSESAGDQTNSLPLDLTLYFPFSLHLLFSRFIIDLCIEHASSSRSKADRLNSYNTRLHSETDSLILLGPFSPEITGCPLNPCRLRVP
jgi:hypothetical protein